MKSTLEFCFRVAIALRNSLAIATLLLTVCLWVIPSAWAQGVLPEDALSPTAEVVDPLLDTVELLVVDDGSAEEVSIAAESVEAALEKAQAPEAELTEIFSPLVEAMTTTEAVLQTDADQTSILEALADVNEAADEQALNAQPETLEGTLQSWFTSAKTFLDLN